MFVAKAALRNMINAFGDIEFGLTSFPRLTQSTITCPDINGNECNDAGPFVGGLGNPQNFNGAQISLANCAGEWDGTPGSELPIDRIPAACRPGVGGNPVARLRAAADPQVCLNYAGNCPGRRFGSFTWPDGDVLVGFQGFGWPGTLDNRNGIYRWIDNTENAFRTTTVEGRFCDHNTTGDCELRPSGPTPLAGTLTAARDYMIPIRMSEPEPLRSCRPYTVLLITDGVETCGGDPAGVAADLRAAGIPVYVVGLAVGGGRGLLNSIATAGGTDAGAPGGDTAFFADDEVTLSVGLSNIVADSLLVEVCNDVDDDCDTLIDEGFVKYCDLPRGITSASLCEDPGERVCDGRDDNCDGRIDEGLLNACGTCGPVPDEICDGIDNNCNGIIDEGGVCDACVPESEVCDGRDNDCDDAIDEDLTRDCGIDIGACERGTQTCVRGSWGACDDVGPGDEICDNIDNDCDGLVDNLTEACGTDVGECNPGIRRCVRGSFGACEGEIGPAGEACDGLDNDCDGEIDEDVPGLGVACGTDEGVCSPGMTSCVGGIVECVGGVLPVEETCDGLDNDCDGLIDDGIFVGTPCGTDVGECSPGFNRCVDGEVSCVDAIDGSDEVCDGLDNDCDGTVDEGLGLGEPCGEDEGACMPGSLRCVDGTPTCVGEVPPGTEVCDCEDNDCDGEIDEESGPGLCPGESRCVECQCALGCVPSEFGPMCPTGRAPVEVDGDCFCVRERCNADTCAGETIERDGEVLCTPDSDDVGACVCKSNECTFSCEGVVCPEGTVCNPRDPSGRCVEDSCVGLGCEEGEICNSDTGECETDPCEVTTCPEGDACRFGMCETSCGSVSCDAGEICRRGVCEDDLCVDVICGSGEVCDPASGDCVNDECAGVLCPEETRCDPVTGDCEEDPCATLRCPDDQTCNSETGECEGEDTPGEDAGVPDAGPDAGPDAASGNRLGLATGGGGCACDAAGAPQRSKLPVLPTLFCFAGLLLLRRRRLRQSRIAQRMTRALASFPLLALSLVILGGCNVDPFCFDCVEDAGVDAPSMDAAPDTSPRDVGPRDAILPDVAEDTLPDGCMPGAPELCNEFDDDCDGEVDEGIDTDSDPANCGGCGTLCSPMGAFGVCEAGECGLGDCDVGFFNLDGDDENGCEYRCLPSAEDDTLCDLRDNDCDGEVDEDVDTATDASNCGMCGRSCRFARADATCVDSVCALGDCNENFYDIDGEPGNGCEYACIPSDTGVETCNARDDDCDGTIDEGNPDGGAACGETAGECTAGVEMCSRGVLVCVGGTGPAVETCNSRDDDCDGETDETTRFDVDPTNCGGCGVTCGEPNAVVRCQARTCTRVACNAGFVDLDGAAGNGCEYECDIRGAEVCNGLDDDCDGRTDESLTPPTRFCNANGVCAGTSATCAGSDGWECNYTSPHYQETENACDRRDNDCDGSVDETFPTVGDSCASGLGICARSGVIECTPDGLATRCTAGSGAGAARDETCDGRDEDCDGRTDEGIAPDAMPTVRMSIPGGDFVYVMSYEASRPDATASNAGLLSTAACSRANRVPWTTVTWGDARTACCALNEGGACPGAGADGWDLCDAGDWQAACEGPTGVCDWSYNSSCGSSQPTACNGAEADPCPGAATECLVSTGSFSGCRTNWGGAGQIYDLSGNVKEWTSTEVVPGVHQIRGGSYNNIETGRTCQFDFTLGDEEFAFPNTGFRCCYYDR